MRCQSPPLDRLGDGPRYRHLKLRDVTYVVFFVVLVVELAALPDEPITAVIHPSNERLPRRWDAVHGPAIHDRCDLNDGEVDDPNAITVGQVLVSYIEPSVQRDGVVLGGDLV